MELPLAAKEVESFQERRRRFATTPRRVLALAGSAPGRAKLDQPKQGLASNGCGSERSQARGGLPNDPVVVRVCPDPDPKNAVRYVSAKRAVVVADSDGPELADTLEVQGRMTSVRLEYGVMQLPEPG